MSDLRASSAVARAVKKGVLPPVTTLRCTDCGVQATAYDHYRGYDRSHWLDVQPVCDVHNMRRSKSRRIPRGDHGTLVLRLSHDLIAAIDDEAEADFRSRQAQLEWILVTRYRERGLDIKDELAPYRVDASLTWKGECLT